MVDKIRTSKAINGLTAALRKAQKDGNKGEVRLDKIADDKLYQVAKKVAGKHAISTSCGARQMVTNDAVDLAKLSKAVQTLTREIKSGDRNKDAFITPDEMKGMSALAKRVLKVAIDEVEQAKPRPVQPDNEPVRTTC